MDIENRRQYYKQWADKNREHVREYQREYWRNHIVEGPKNTVKWINGRTIVIHDDFFGWADLLSCGPGTTILGHSVTDLAHKAEHAKDIFECGFNGDLWCYVNRRGFNRYWVHNDNGEMRIELLEEGVKPGKEGR